VALRGGTRFPVKHEVVFPDGCKYLPDSIGEVEDYDEKTGRRTPAKDKVTGQRVYQVRVYDMDVELGKRAREVAVKIVADVQPVPPVGPFEEMEFENLVVTPYVAANGRMAYSFRATGMRVPVAAGKSRQAAA
jgi:hypothetical protein